MNKSTKPSGGRKQSKQKEELHFPLGKKNFALIGVGFLMVIIGIALMYGNEDIYSFRKTGLSVLFVLAGFILKIYAVLMKDKAAE